MAPKSEEAAGAEKKNGAKDDADKKKKKEDLPPAEEDLSEEDKQLKEDLELCLTRLGEDDDKLYAGALETLTKLIRASTTSMTSVPKPLKFMMPHFEAMKAAHERISDVAVKSDCADVVSVLAMTMSDAGDCLKYKLLGDQSQENIEAWGHEYVRHLAGEIVTAWNDLPENAPQPRKDELLHLVKNIVPSQMKHHAEAEACDLLMEVEQLTLLKKYVDKTAFHRVCLYLTSCVPFVPDPENTNLLRTALDIFREFEQYPQAMRLALQLNDPELVREIFVSCPDRMIQKQLAFVLGRQQHYLTLDEDDYDEYIEIMSNSQLNQHFLNLARELDIMEAKAPEDVYKSHLDNVRPSFGGSSVDSARANLSSSFVNGFVNCGFGTDKLLMEDGNKWLYKNKEHGMMSATASVGLILLWDVDGGLTQIDKYLYSQGNAASPAAEIHAN
jgi:26S proteasome regulatory subunit N1